jgi:hypothetical protein
VIVWRAHADLAAPHAAVLPDLLEHVADDVGGRREAESFVAARLREDQRVDPDDFSVHVHERTAAVARVDGRVRLQVDHRVVRLELPRDGADHAKRHGAVEPHRAAEGEHSCPGCT